jgi:hypothetical protein
LGKTVAVSFEGAAVKVVHASLKGKTVTVERTETIPDNEFDDYLRREKASEFIVTGEFKESYHDIITTPVVKKQFLEKIIESEIKKVLIQRAFSFIYSRIGEKIIDNKRVLEVFYYAVPKESIRMTVERFYNNGKAVKAIFPPVFAVAALFDDRIAGEAHMAVFNSGKSRTVFFTKQGVVYFIRNYESYEAALSEFDIQNINMTINYCFQNLRINPSSVFLMGTISESSGNNAITTSPLASLSIPAYIHCRREQFNEFLLPIASLLTGKSSNIISREFREVYSLKTYITYASKVFMILALLCAALMFAELKYAAEEKDLIHTAKQGGIDKVKLMDEITVREDKIAPYVPLIEFLNKPEPRFHKLLASLGKTDFGGLKINMLNASANSDRSLSVSMHGAAPADSYSAMQDSLEHMTDELKKNKNIDIRNRSVDLKDKTFILEIYYKDEE